MNWIHFLLWLGGIYFLYYLAAILGDTFKNQKSRTSTAARNALSFTEQFTPDNAAALVKDQAAGIQGDRSPEIIASGGVVLKDVFSLARKEAIIYVKEVGF